MDQRLFVNAAAEIIDGGDVAEVDAAPEHDVRGERDHRHGAARDDAEIGGEHQERARAERGGDHDQQRRQDAAGAPLVEARQREGVAAELSQQDAGDQIPADDEEHVDADEPALRPAKFGVEEDHAEHRDGAQPVDISSVWEGRAAGLIHLRRLSSYVPSPSKSHS